MRKNGNIHPERVFKTPQELEKAWSDYKESIKQQSEQWQKVRYVGTRGQRKSDSTKIPYTFEGFKRFCSENYGSVDHYFRNTGNYYDDFCLTCTRVREEIRENQIIGGLLGFYKPSITQHLTGI